MPKKKMQETQAEQSERFKKDAQKLIDAGELDPDAAERSMERLLRNNRSADGEQR